MKDKTMKRYSIGTPPTGAGIYQLHHAKTGMVYVGQTIGLSRRLTEWRGVMKLGYGHTNYEMQQALMSMPDTDEWEFVIVKEMPGATKDELLAAELEQIGYLRGIDPALVLNVPPNLKKEITGGNRPKSGTIAILTKEGGFVGQATAARMLERNIDTIRDKVRWLRDNGVKEVLLDDLLMDRRKILEKAKGY